MTESEALELVKRAGLDALELTRESKANHQLGIEEAVGQLAALREIEAPETLTQLAVELAKVNPTQATS